MGGRCGFYKNRFKDFKRTQRVRDEVKRKGRKSNYEKG